MTVKRIEIVHFDMDNICSYYGFSRKDIETALSELVAESKLLPYENGYILPEDAEAVNMATEPFKGVIALQRNEFLIRTNAHILYDRFKNADYDIKYFLLIDGGIRGAVYGFLRYCYPERDIYRV